MTSETLAGEVDFQKKVQYLESTMNFLKKQHHDVLDALHAEVDRLKRHNQELQYQIAMLQAFPVSNTDFSAAKTTQENTDSRTTLGTTTKMVTNVTDDDDDVSNAVTSQQDDAKDDLKDTKKKLDKLQMTFMEEEVNEIKKMLKDEKLQNIRLRDQLAKETANKPPSSVIGGLSQLVYSNVVPHRPSEPKPSSEHQQQQQQHSNRAPKGAASLPFGASVEPLQVRVYPQLPRPPTLQECEVIIRHLVNENGKQSNELSKMKTDLRDVLYTHKWTPDSYLLAKSYLPDDDEDESATTSNRKDPTNQKLSSQQQQQPRAFVSTPKDNVILPSTMQAMSYRLTERKNPRLLPRRRLVSHQALGLNTTKEGGIQ